MFTRQEFGNRMLGYLECRNSQELAGPLCRESSQNHLGLPGQAGEGGRQGQQWRLVRSTFRNLPLMQTSIRIEPVPPDSPQYSGLPPKWS